MTPGSTLETVYTLADVSFRWSHVASVVVWLGAIYLCEFVCAGERGAATFEAFARSELSRRVAWWFRWAAAVGWSSGMLLLFSHYYHGLLGPVLFDVDIAPDVLELLTKENGHPNVRGWAPGFLALVIGYATYEALFVFARTRVLEALAALIGAVLWIMVGWVLDTKCFYSGRAAWVHMGALGGGVVAGNVWFRIWPALQSIFTAVDEGRPVPPGDVRIVRSRVRHSAYVAAIVLLFMLSNHYPLLYGDNPWPWPRVAAAGIGVGVATVFGLGRWARRSNA